MKYVPLFLKLIGLAAVIAAVFFVCFAIVSAAIAGHWGSYRAVGVYRASGSGSGFDHWHINRSAGSYSYSRAYRCWNCRDRSRPGERFQRMRADVRTSFESGKSSRTIAFAESSSLYERAGSLRFDASRGAQQFQSDLDGARTSVLESATGLGGRGMYRRSSTGWMPLQDFAGRLAVRRNVRLAGGGWLWLNLLELVRRLSRSDCERSDCSSGSDTGRGSRLLAGRQFFDRGYSGRGSSDRSWRAASVGGAAMRAECS